MATESDFLVVLQGDPADAVTRLVFADWLAEREDPREGWVRNPDLARWSLPGLVDPYRKMLDDVPGEGSKALVGQGQRAVPYLLAALGDIAQGREHEVRQDLLFDVLQEIIDADEVLRALHQRLTINWDEDRPIPWDRFLLAAQELKHLGPRAAALVPRLWGVAYYQERPELVAVGLELYDHLGPAAPGAFWYVWEYCQDLNSNADFYRPFFAAISRQPPHPLTLRILTHALNWDEPLPEAQAAFRALGQGAIASLVVGPTAGRDHSRFHTWLAALREYGPDIEPLVFAALEQEYARWGGDLTASPTWHRLTTVETPTVTGDRPPALSRRVLAALAAAALHADSILAEAGLEALTEVGYQFGPADVAPLRRLLSSPGKYCPHRAADALGVVGPAADAALPDLAATLQDRYIRYHVALAVARIRSEEAAAEMLRPYLNLDADPSDLGCTFHALAFLEAEGRRFLPEVLAYCRRHPPSYSLCEARSLARGWVEHHPEVLDELLALLRSGEEESVQVALSILVAWSKIPEGARADLTALRDHPSPEIRERVRRALGEGDGG